MEGITLNVLTGYLCSVAAETRRIVTNPRFVAGLLFVLTLFVVGGGSAFAQTTPTVPQECTDLGTVTGMTPDNAIGCIYKKLNPGAYLLVILSLFTGPILVIWGLRGGFAFLARLVSSMFSMFIRRG